MTQLVITSLLLCFTACSSSGILGDRGAVFGDPGLTSANPTPSKSGALTVAILSDPSPAVRGLAVFEYRITDSSGKPVDGLNLEITPFMPQMNHGLPVAPAVTPMGGGVYQVSNVDLFMPGEVELRTAITGQVSDSVVPTVTVN